MKALQLEFLKPIEKAARRLVKYEVDHVRKAVDQHLVRSASSFEKWMEDFYVGMVGEIEDHLGPVFDKYIQRTKKTGVNLINADINQFPALKKWKRKYIEGYTLRHIGSSSGQLLEILKNTPIEDVQKVFGTRLDEWLEKRPGKIARNEVIKASNATLRETYRIGGVTKLKWINTGSKSCSFCQGLNGKIVGIESNFIEHGETLEGETGTGRKLKIYGPKAHPPCHAFCQCSVIPVFEAGSIVKGFVKAKTIAEVEEYIIKKGIADNVGLSGGRTWGGKATKKAALKKANDVLSEMDRFEREYSIKIPKVDTFYITKNKRGKAHYTIPANESSITFADDWDERTWKNINAWESRHNKPWDGYEAESHTAINVRHEYAHILQGEYEISKPGTKAFKDLDKIRLKVFRDEKFPSSQISDYAGKNKYEWFCDGFAKYTSPYYTKGTFPKSLEKYFDGILDKLKV